MGSDDVPLANIEIALTESEDVESKVQEAAAELEHADAAMYAAKQQQKGPFAYSRIAMSGRG